MDIHDTNLLTNSDFEHLMEDLGSDTNFSPLNVDQGYGQGTRNAKAIDAVATPMNTPLLEDFGQGKKNQKKIESLEATINPTLEDYNGVQEISEAIETKEIVQSTTQVDFLQASFSPTSTLPCRDDYPGPLKFDIFLDSTTAHKRSWVFSTPLRKVFIDMNKTLLMKFRILDRVSGLFVRALPVYSIADHVSVPVQRCALHELNDDPFRQAHSQHGLCQCSSYGFVRHVVRTTHSQAQYDYDCESDRHSVLVPLDIPQPGSDMVVVEYFFTCKTSCPYGMNRKPIDVIFTLETEHCEVLGRQVLPVKICSCPKRDKDKEEADAKTNNDGKLKSSPPTKRRLSSSDKQDSASKKVKTENENKATVYDINSLGNLKLLEVIQTQASHIVELRNEIALQREEITQQREEIFRHIADLSSNVEGRLEAIFQYLQQSRI